MDYLYTSVFLFVLLPIRVSVNIPDVLRWCVVSSSEQQKCADMASAFKSKGLTPDIKCVYGDSVPDCMKKIKVTNVSLMIINSIKTLNYF